MKAAQNKCIWYDQCESCCLEDCQDFTPSDLSELDEEFYFGVLAENEDEYMKVVLEYEDGPVDSSV